MLPLDSGLTTLVPSPRAGRRFEPIAERQLDGDLRQLAERLPGSGHGLLLAAEVPGPRGVPDLVVTTRAGDSLERRLQSGLTPLLGMTDSVIAAATPIARSLSADSVARRLGMSDRQVATRLRALERSGHVYRDGGGYRRANELQPIGRTYALEAKVTDWRRGLSQALRYSSWCDAAAVVLLDQPRDVAAVAKRFRHLGIGFAVRSTWVVRPRIGRPNAGWRLWASEQTALSVAGRQ